MQIHSYCSKVCHSQRQLLLVVTSLNIHNPRVRTHTHCCCNVLSLFTWLHVSVMKGGSSAVALIFLLPFLLFSLCIFLSVIFNYFNHTCIIFIGARSVINTGIPILCPIQPQLSSPLNTWISDQWRGAQPVLNGVFAPLVLEWNWRREKLIFMGKIFNAFRC